MEFLTAVRTAERRLAKGWEKFAAAKERRPDLTDFYTRVHLIPHEAPWRNGN